MMVFFLCVLQIARLIDMGLNARDIIILMIWIGDIKCVCVCVCVLLVSVCMILYIPPQDIFCRDTRCGSTSSGTSHEE